MPSFSYFLQTRLSTPSLSESGQWCAYLTEVNTLEYLDDPAEYKRKLLQRRKHGLSYCKNKDLSQLVAIFSEFVRSSCQYLIPISLKKSINSKHFNPNMEDIAGILFCVFFSSATMIASSQMLRAITHGSAHFGLLISFSQ